MHRGAHPEPVVYTTLAALNTHLALCYPGMDPMVKGQCNLGLMDHPAEKRGDENKRSRKE